MAAPKSGAPAARSSSAPARSALARPTLAQMRVFVAVADAGSFSEAAAGLGMSQSSLSEAVAGLERALGARLFRRSAEGSRLTPQGERALPHARRAAQASEDLSLSVQDERDLRGMLTIASYRSLGVHLLPPVLARLHRLHPHLQVRIINPQSVQAGGRGGEGGAHESGAGLLRARKADVVLMNALNEGEGLLSYAIARDEYLALLPASSRKRRLAWADLQGQTLLLPPAGDASHQQVVDYLRARGVGTGSVMEIDEDDVIYSMVAHGLGVTVQPALAASPLAPGLRALPLPEPLYRDLHVAVLPQRAGLPHIRAFLNALAEGESG